MFRMGCFTKKIYTIEDYNNGLEECCIRLPESVRKDTALLWRIQELTSKRCEHCRSCPAYQKAVKKCRRKSR